MPQQPTKKRKATPKTIPMTLLQRLQSACDFLTDEGQLELLLTVCERSSADTTSEYYPKWAKRSGSFLNNLNIVPREWNPNFDFPIDKLEAIASWCNLDDSWEKLVSLKQSIGECFPQNNLTERSVMQLLSAVERIVEIFTESHLGKLVASAGMTTLLGVLTSVFPDIIMNGDKHSIVSLGEELPFHLRNDGYLETKQKGYTFLLREDKSLDKHLDWCSHETDCYKLILCMKSLLRVKNHDEVLIVRSTSVIKEVGDEERRIILKLANRHEHCLYLPNILNIYTRDVEFEHLQPLPSNKLDDEFLLMMACDLSIALRYLHKNNIVHGDVKPSNTMIRQFNNPSTYTWFVLIDFGLSFEMVKEQGKCYKLLSTGKKVLANENVGTNLFQAPEVRSKQNYDEKIDIYSLGASLLYLKNSILYETIFAKEEYLQHGLKTLEWENVAFGEKVLEMINADPKKRPTSQELAEYFSSFYHISFH